MIRKSLVLVGMLTAYEGEITPPAPPPAPPAPPPDDKSKLYTQAEFDKHMAGLRRKQEAETKKIADELKTLAEDKNKTTEEREQFRLRAEELEKTYMTEKELAARREKELAESKDKEIKNLSEELNTTRSELSMTLINHELAKAEAEHEVLVPGQVSDMIRNRIARKDEVGPDGKPTGKKVIRVSFDDVDTSGKPVTLELSVSDALKRMKELPNRFGNLFKATNKGGVGGSNGQGSGGGTSVNALKDTKTYLEQRKAAGGKIPGALGR